MNIMTGSSKGRKVTEGRMDLRDHQVRFFLSDYAKIDQGRSVKFNVACS